MDSKKLSAVLEKKIRRLCLNDFPCGPGSWRKTKNSSERAGTEDTDTLLDLVNCPHSPWWHDDSWSPQVPALRQLAVLTPERLHTDFIYSYFTTLCIVDKDVTVIDNGLLKFSKLEELVLSMNKISEIPVQNLPSTLKTLELRANRLSSLNPLTTHSLPRLQYLSLASNSLGSHEDVFYLTGRLWLVCAGRLVLKRPQLVCLDLSDCEFQDQQALLKALGTLPCLKTLVLEGNPFTLASSYPGLTVDTLPQLSFLDALWISPEERKRFMGLANLRGLLVDQASVKVSVGRVRGIQDPMISVDENSPDFPIVTYSFFIAYEFFTHQTPVNLPKVDTPATARVMEDSCSDAHLQSDKNREGHTSKPNTGVFVVNTEKSGNNIAHVSRHRTSKLAWSECMDFSDTQMYTVSNLGGLKKFLNKGLQISLEEEKVLSWPAAPEDVLVAKPSQSVKEKNGAKGKDSSSKSGSTKDMSKAKKKKSAPKLNQDAPIRRMLGSVHIPLQSLVKGSQKVNILCDLGALHKESEVGATQTLERDPGKKIKDKDKESKLTASSNGEGRKGREMDVHTDNSMSIPLEPLTVELSVELEKWQSASEALTQLLQHQKHRACLN